jgi:hypothetical protein
LFNKSLTYVIADIEPEPEEEEEAPEEVDDAVDEEVEVTVGAMANSLDCAKTWLILL